MKPEGFLRRRIIDPVLTLLKQGVTPEKIALSLAFGIAIGVLPVLGSGTLLCTVAAILLRLNLPAMQAANWISYPLQLALLIPFFRWGEIAFAAPHVPLTPSQLVGMFQADFWGSIRALWDTTLRGIAVWAVAAAAFIPLCYFLMKPILTRIPFRSPS